VAFRGNHGSTITIVDVPVRGSFPSDFRIDLFEPPPDATLAYATRQHEGEPRVGFGYITAVTSDHPDMLYSGNSVAVTNYGCQPENRPDNLCMTREVQTCVVPSGITPCYIEKTLCPSEDASPDDCIMETSGDPALTISNILDYFAGFSQNYQVIYLEDGARAGSATATYFGSQEDIPAGYSLYKVQIFSNEEALMLPAKCQDHEVVQALAAKMYNEAHGTDYENVECTGENNDPPFCSELTIDDDDLAGETGIRGEVNRLLERANIQLGCPIVYTHYERVGDPGRTSISVVIDAEPPSF
jgi:hypothetical protein